MNVFFIKETNTFAQDIEIFSVIEYNGRNDDFLHKRAHL